MSKYATNEYIVRLFDKHGSKRCDLPGENWLKSKKLGEEQMGDGSFVVLRVVYNSLDPHPTVDNTFKEAEGLISDD